MTDKPKQDDPEQSARFLQGARELGVDEKGKKFDQAFKKIVQKAKRTGKKR